MAIVRAENQVSPAEGKSAPPPAVSSADVPPAYDAVLPVLASEPGDLLMKINAGIAEQQKILDEKMRQQQELQEQVARERQASQALAQQVEQERIAAQEVMARARQEQQELQEEVKRERQASQDAIVRARRVSSGYAQQAEQVTMQAAIKVSELELTVQQLEEKLKHETNKRKAAEATAEAAEMRARVAEKAQHEMEVRLVNACGFLSTIATLSTERVEQLHPKNKQASPSALSHSQRDPKGTSEESLAYSPGSNVRMLSSSPRLQGFSLSTLPHEQRYSLGSPGLFPRSGSRDFSSPSSSSSDHLNLPVPGIDSSLLPRPRSGSSPTPAFPISPVGSPAAAPAKRPFVSASPSSRADVPLGSPRPRISDKRFTG